jgi:IS605 OrfB family transposase
MSKKDHALQEHIIAEASLSVEHPISVTVDKDNYQIGTKEEFLYRRLAIQAARHRLQKASTYNKGGNGRKRKLKSLEHYNQKEKNYVDSRLHLYSRRLIDICVKSQAGTLLLVNQSNKEEVAKEDEFLLRNWSYFGLIEKIKYKAKMVGINVITE